jgi:hypothetical protein
MPNLEALCNMYGTSAKYSLAKQLLLLFKFSFWNDAVSGKLHGLPFYLDAEEPSRELATVFTLVF